MIAATLDAFSPAELHAMWLDNELDRYGVRGFEFFLPLGEAPTLRDRARSLAPLMLPGRVFTGATAAWIYTGAHPPAEPTYRRRNWRPRGAALLAGHTQLASEDVTNLFGLCLTTVSRTCEDLAVESDTARLLSMLRMLAVLHPIDVIYAVNLPHRAQ